MAQLRVATLGCEVGRYDLLYETVQSTFPDADLYMPDTNTSYDVVAA
jgi:hypothetical protein